jgi:hypothetical protein
MLPPVGVFPTFGVGDLDEKRQRSSAYRLRLGCSVSNTTGSSGRIFIPLQSGAAGKGKDPQPFSPQAPGSTGTQKFTSFSSHGQDGRLPPCSHRETVCMGARSCCANALRLRPTACREFRNQKQILNFFRQLQFSTIYTLLACFDMLSPPFFPFTPLEEEAGPGL